MPERTPVTDWATDYDIFDAGYVENPFPIWDELREVCPVAHTERWGGSWLPTRYDDVAAMARLVPQLSSTGPLVVPPVPLPPGDPTIGIGAAPISSDPPEHTWSRRLILPYFSPQAVESHRPFTEALCARLLDGFADSGHADAAADYAQQIPGRVIAHLIGIDPERCDEFVGWVRGVLEQGLTDPELRMASRRRIIDFFRAEIADRRANPRNDLVTHLVNAEVDGNPVPEVHILGTLNLMLIAGVDTTWSSIGSALWHLASHPDDRRRLVAEPDLMPTAVEELLRAYSPVTMGRVVTERVDYDGLTLCPGDKVLMNFPAANRDPEVFERADEVVLDRQRNRHIAFGVGIHRCAGSNLARMEMQVALGSWLERIPEFDLAPGAEVTWAGGQVRGPRQLPVVF